jgi:hypothetical protein
MLSDELWGRWIEVQRKSLKLMNRRDFEGALHAIDEFIEDLEPKQRGEPFSFRSIIREKMGDPEGAERDLLDAQSLSAPATYHRYGIELALGRLAEERNDHARAASWYLHAIKTATEDPSTSGAVAVESLLSIKATGLWSPAERALCERAIRQAWKLFSLPGEPQMADIPNVLRRLTEAATRPLPSAQA